MEAASVADVTPSNRAFAATGGPPRPQKAIGYARSESKNDKGEVCYVAVCNEAYVLYSFADAARGRDPMSGMLCSLIPTLP